MQSGSGRGRNRLLKAAMTEMRFSTLTAGFAVAAKTDGSETQERNRQNK